MTVYIKNPLFLKDVLHLFQDNNQILFDVFCSEMPETHKMFHNVKWNAIDGKQFIKSLASSRALISTAGNLVAGIIKVYIRKPVQK